MDDGIIYVKRTERNVCGGTDATLDTKAPHEIESNDIVYFSAGSALGYVFDDGMSDHLYRFGAFAAKSDAGTFLYLRTEDDRYSAPELSIVTVKEDVLPALAALVRECGLADGNGYHSTTHGLPENFGGEVDVLFSSGERISFSDNQSPIISYENAIKIVEFMKDAMAKEPAAFPDPDTIASVAFSNEWEDGYVRATMTVSPDGTGTNAKESRYGESVYNSEKAVDAETVSKIKDTVKRFNMLSWSGLPESGYWGRGNKSLAFTFKDGAVIAVKDDRKLPFDVGNGFFNIELELSTKH